VPNANAGQNRESRILPLSSQNKSNPATSYNTDFEICNSRTSRRGRRGFAATSWEAPAHDGTFPTYYGMGKPMIGSEK
jgi:hypothetical protein